MIDVEWALSDTHPTYVSSPNVFIEVWRKRINSDFRRCIKAVEKLHEIVSERFPNGSRAVTGFITESLAEAETDIGISWQDGFFSKKGVELLDEKLVNESLRWLADPKYQSVLIPFQKGLSHLHQGTNDAQRYGDAVTDMYEALEAIGENRHRQADEGFIGGARGIYRKAPATTHT